MKIYGWKRQFLIFLILTVAICTGIYLFAIAIENSKFKYHNLTPTPLISKPQSASITSPTPSATPQEQVFCTQDAKMCPDGSFVGRDGPRCEFKKCPGE